MAAATHDLTIDKGSTYRKTFTWLNSNKLPIDLTNYTARMDIRKTTSSDTAIISLTTANGRITITPAEGKVELFISDTDTAAITDRSGLYDLELVSSGGEVTKLVRGSVHFREEITK